MSGSRTRVWTVARREFWTTIRRRAFLLTLLGTPAYFAFVTLITARAGIEERLGAMKNLTVIGVVDSSGLFRNASREIATTIRSDLTLRGRPALPETLTFRTAVRFYPDLAGAQAAVRAREIPQAVVIPSDYLERGRVRRYASPNSPFSSADRRAIAAWLSRNLVAGRVDTAVASRVSRPIEEDRLFTLDRGGSFQLKDDRREVVDLMVPLAVSLLLGLSIMIGGQYLLQGVAEEKESRILESLMCQVSAQELMTGKLLGLGAVGLVVVLTWVGAGAAMSLPMLAAMPLGIRPELILIALAYFIFGYLFFGSIMTGIGAVTNNMREAQQFAVWFTFANFVPFLLFTTILSRPDSPVAFWLSIFPPTASTTMMLRLASPASQVPLWQVGLSLATLGLAGWIALVGAARVFRIGLLMYGKTPNLPEILRWAVRRA